MGAHGSKPTVTRGDRDEYASSEVQQVLANYLSSNCKSSVRPAWEGQQCASNFPKQGAKDEVTLAGGNNVRGNHSANATSILSQSGTKVAYQQRRIDKLVGQQQELTSATDCGKLGTGSIGRSSAPVDTQANCPVPSSPITKVKQETPNQSIANAAFNPASPMLATGDRPSDGCNQNSPAQPQASSKEKQPKQAHQMPDGAVAPASPARKAESADAVQWVIRPGPSLDSVYKVGKLLGQGSFGVVRAATHRATGAQVAVKSIRKSLLAASDVTALRREVEILHHLSGHPAISQLLGTFEEASQLHLVLELYTGGDLFDAIIGCGRHSERVAADVMRTVLTAIAYCHAMGVAHRDIKPENFMLTAEQPQPLTHTTSSGSSSSQPQPQLPPSPQRPKPGISAAHEAAPTLGARLKLIDFGLSTFCTDDTPLTEIVGTSYYVAPEVLGGRYSLSADVWSAGVILHIMLTGYAPFDGRDDKDILKAVRRGKLDLTTDPVWRSISSEATAVMKSMLDRDPAKRATAEQLLSTPWLGRTPAACTASATPLPGRVLDRLAAFARMSSFKKEARRVLAGLMRPEEVAGLVAQFRGLDADRDGRLSWEELKAGLTRQALLRGSGHSASASGGSSGSGPLSDGELRELLKRVDLNGDGILDESEFLGALLPTAAITRRAHAAAAAAAASDPGGSSSAAAAASLRRPDSAGEAVAAAFAHFDKDGSGYITTEELRRALATHHPSRRGLDVAALLSRHDRDADGRISFPEFIDMLVTDIEVEPEEHPSPDKGARSGGAGGGGAEQAVYGGRRGDLSLLAEDLAREEDAASGGQKAGVGVGGTGDGPTGEGGGRGTGRSSGGATVGKPSFAWAAEGDADGAVPAPAHAGATGAAARAAAVDALGGRIQPLDWSDECRGRATDAASGEDVSPAAATSAAGNVTSIQRGSPPLATTAGKGTAPAPASPSAASSRTPGGSPPIGPTTAGAMPSRPASRLVPTPPPISAPLLALAPQPPQSPCHQPPQMTRQSTPGAVTGSGGGNVFSGRRASNTGMVGSGRGGAFATLSQPLQPQPSPPKRLDPNADMGGRGGAGTAAAHRLSCTADSSIVAAAALQGGFYQPESLLDEDLLPPLTTNSPRLVSTTSIAGGCQPRAISRVSAGGGGPLAAARPQAPSGAYPSLRADIRSRRHSACEVQMPEGMGAMGGGIGDMSAAVAAAIVAGGGHRPYTPLTVQLPSEPRSPLLPLTAGGRGTTQCGAHDYYGAPPYAADLTVVCSPRLPLAPAAAATTAGGLLSLPGSPAAVLGGGHGIGGGGGRNMSIAGRHGSGVVPTPLSPSGPSPSPLSPSAAHVSTAAATAGSSSLRNQTSLSHQHQHHYQLQHPPQHHLPHHQHYHYQTRQSPQQQPTPPLMPTSNSPDRDHATASPVPTRPTATPLSPSSSRRHPRVAGPGGIGMPVTSVPSPVPTPGLTVPSTTGAGAGSSTSAALGARRSLQQITPIPAGPPSGTAQRVATPSAPLPLLMPSAPGSRRQSTGSPFWQPAGPVHPIPQGGQQAPASPHVMTAPLMELGTMGTVSMRSRRSPGMGTGCEDLILTTRASVDMDLNVIGVPLSGGLEDDDGGSGSAAVQSPAGGGGGAAGWNYGLPYGAVYGGGGNLMPSSCGRR